LLCISVVAVAFGANPVGRVISSAPVDIDGIAGPARNYVPVGIGDEITTKSASAVVQFADGSGVTLQPNSKLRIEGQASNVSVRVVAGSAVYDLTHTSKVHVVNSKGETVNGTFDHPLLPVGAQGPDPLTAAVVYRSSPQRQTGMVVPSSAILYGTFVQRNVGVGSGPIDPAIILPNGLTINLSSSTNATTGVVTYTVTSVTATVTLPSGGTQAITITSGALIGDTITPPPAGSQTGTSAGGVTVSTPNGQAVTDPNSVLQSTVNTGVTTAINNSTLPANTTAPTPAPITTGQFSNSAS